MAAIRLKAGQSVVVVAVDPSLEVGGGPMPGGGDQPVDPGYGIDLGLGTPSHPIVLPPDPAQPLPIDPGWSGGVAPPGQEGGAPRPDHTLPGHGSAGGEHPDNTLPPPGEIPPPIEPPAKPTPGWEVKVAWTPTTGWVVVAIPTGPHVTPSKRK
jgi:hypothetical protein